jgi:hypothetical protein
VHEHEAHDGEEHTVGPTHHVEQLVLGVHVQQFVVCKGGEGRRHREVDTKYLSCSIQSVQNTETAVTGLLCENRR